MRQQLNRALKTYEDLDKLKGITVSLEKDIIKARMMLTEVEVLEDMIVVTVRGKFIGGKTMKKIIDIADKNQGAFKMLPHGVIQIKF